jgi:hypothetical protein
MTEVSSGLAYYTDQEVDNLLTAAFHFILNQMELASRIINLLPDSIKTI